MSDVTASSELLAAIRVKFEKVFARNLTPHDKKQRVKVTLDDPLLECFSNLSPKCRDEEVEDLIYFMLDLYQFQGVPVAAFDVDITQMVVDLRAVLEEHAAKVREGDVFGNDDKHLFLVLDKNVQAIPWESIPVLRGRSVSRIPSLALLIDRLHLARQQHGLSISQTHEEGIVVDRALVDPTKATYILNPSGDLKTTQDQFLPWLQEMHAVGWEGIVDRPPTENEMLNALTRKDLVM